MAVLTTPWVAYAWLTACTSSPTAPSPPAGTSATPSDNPLTRCEAGDLDVCVDLIGAFRAEDPFLQREWFAAACRHGVQRACDARVEMPDVGSVPVPVGRWELVDPARFAKKKERDPELTEWRLRWTVAADTLGVEERIAHGDLDCVARLTVPVTWTDGEMLVIHGGVTMTTMAFPERGARIHCAATVLDGRWHLVSTDGATMTMKWIDSVSTFSALPEGS